MPFNPFNQWLFLESPHTKTSFGIDRKKQGCPGRPLGQSARVIRSRGKLYTDATMVLLSPFESLVLEAVQSSLVASPRKRFRPRMGDYSTLFTLRAVADWITLVTHKPAPFFHPM